MNHDIALIGLGVMGQNLARNLANKQIKVIGWDRHEEKSQAFIKKYGNENLTYCEDFSCLAQKLKAPRIYLMMVPAGEPVDEVIAKLEPFLEKGDILIDGGNSNFDDSIRREKELSERGIHFVGMGVSGGEEGALNGPSLMPGGSTESWTTLQPILEKIAARDFSGQPCVTHIGENGAGHYVKMVHNGIEYGVMQLMAEAYLLLKTLYQLNPPEIADIFEQFGQGKLNSFLFDIAVPILRKKDRLSEGYLIDHILDQAGQKGTGRWTAIDALKRGVSLPSITAAVFARNISAEKEARKSLSESYQKSKKTPQIELKKLLPHLENALHAGMISCYAQGFELMKKAAEEQGWELNFDEISRIWEGGCIIRAKLLGELHQAFSSAKDHSPHLFSIQTIQESLKKNLESWQKVVCLGIENSIPMPSLVSSLTYFEESTTDPCSANFIQGLRDYFGAHTYQRTDREGVFHTTW